MRKRLLILTALGILVVTVAVTGCGGKGSKTSHKTTPNPTISVSVFLTKGESVSQVKRPAKKVSVEEALSEMLKGPTATEKKQGYSTAIPEGTKLRSYSVADDHATVGFSKEMLNYDGGSSRVQAIRSQIDNTIMNNNKTIKTVIITVDGKPADEVLQP